MVRKVKSPLRKRPRVNNKELPYVIQLTSTNGIGPISFYSLIQKYGNAENAVNALAQQKEVSSFAAAEKEIALAQHLNVELILYTDPRYPQKLKNIPDAPPLLYALGNIDLLNYPISLAIVGARNASIAGRKTASRIAFDLTNSEVLVVSGMARGIDSAAHKGSLYAKNQQGSTIAILGTGVDVIYPEENCSLYQQIKNHGLLLSEFPLGTPAQTSNFPRRNRLISGLTDGTLVVESSLHSGSLITAKFALEQGKDIFAVPGSPLENRSAGPNHLIKDGAILTESAEDILEVLKISQNQQIKDYKMSTKPLDKVKNNVNISPQENVANLTGAKTPLLELISYEGVDIDELLRHSGLAQAEFFTQILDLEFSGKIERQVGNRVARIK